MKNYVKDKVIIITGGSSGFGLAAAGLLLEMGGKVVITGRNPERLATAEKELASSNLLAVQADAVSTADWKRLVQKTNERFGAIDVLVNNHGAGVNIAEVDQQDDATIQNVLDVNLI